MTTKATKAIRVSERGFRRLKMIAARTDESMYAIVDRLLNLEEISEPALRRLEHLNSEETGRCRVTEMLRRSIRPTSNGSDAKDKR